MSTTLYIGNIPFGVAEECIKELLCKIGQVVSMRFMTDQYSFQPKWFGFVEMATVAEAKKAMKALNGKMLLNRPLIVLQRNNKAPVTKPCSFCIAKRTCNKPEAERNNKCNDYMLKTGSEKESNE
ncbi:MAG TPA: RNA-binding protein [Geobacteraceae bacterium]|nr:RNA-binding protein [Geobacteraceae bacterium]